MLITQNTQIEYFKNISIIIKKIQDEINMMFETTSLTPLRQNTPKQIFSCYILQKNFGSQRAYSAFCERMNATEAYGNNKVFGYSSYRIFLGTREGSLDIQKTLLVIIMLALPLDEAIYFSMLNNHNFFIPSDSVFPQYFDFLNEICGILPTIESLEKRFEYAEKLRKINYKSIKVKLN